MDRKLLFFDTETCGLSGKVNGMHQVSGIIDVNGKTVDKFNFNMAPFEQDYVVAEALKTSHVTRDMIYNYPPPDEIHKKLLKIFDKHVNKYKKTDKFFMVAYNSNFDHDHLRNFWYKNEDKFFGSYFFIPDICIMRYAARFLMSERNKLANFKQGTVAQHLGIASLEDSRWHDAEFDTYVAREIYYYIEERVIWGKKY